MSRRGFVGGNFKAAATSKSTAAQLSLIAGAPDLASLVAAAGARCAADCLEGGDRHSRTLWPPLCRVRVASSSLQTC